MRFGITAWVAACCVLLSGSTAQAGTLTSAYLSSNLAGMVPITATGTAMGSAIGNVSLTVGPAFSSIQYSSLRLGPIFVSQPTRVPVFISRTLGGSQTINSTNVANQPVVGATNQFIGTGPGGSLLFHVGLSIGVGGTFMATSTLANLGGAPVTVSATFFPWTTGTVMFTGLTSTTFTTVPIHNIPFLARYQQNARILDRTFSGSNSLIDGVGRITLVSPTRTYVCIGAAADAGGPCVQNNGGNNTLVSTTVSATRLTLNFAAPEPGTALLLAASLVGLAARKRES